MVEMEMENWEKKLEEYLIPYSFEEVMKKILRRAEKMIEDGDTSVVHEIERLCDIRTSLAWHKNDFVFYFSENKIWIDNLCHIKSINNNNKEKEKRLMEKYVFYPYTFEYCGIEYRAIIA